MLKTNYLLMPLSEMCPWDTAPVTTEHMLQHCPQHDGRRGDTWPEKRPLREKLREKLYSDLGELERTAAFVRGHWSGRLKEAIDNADDEEESLRLFTV